MSMLPLPYSYPVMQRGLFALMDEEDAPRGLLGLFDDKGYAAGARTDAGNDVDSGLGSQAWKLTQQAFEPYVTFYQNSVVRPFYAGLDALGQTPFGDPAFYASIQGAGPPGGLIGGSGAAGAYGLRGLTALARRAGFGGSAPKPAVLENSVLLDSSVIPDLRLAPVLGGRILEGEAPIVSYVTGPELRNAVLTGRGLKGVPRDLDDLPILWQQPSLDARINIRGDLNPNKPGIFGNGIIGAQAIENEIPLVTNDKLFKMAVRKRGGEVR